MVSEAKKKDDPLPYESYALKQTHPLHLYSLGKLLGLNATPYQKARVLELACASGGNLIPLAFHEKSATFVGIDIAATQIHQGQMMIKDLNLHNIALQTQSILDFNLDEKFDYIICHGLFSWVEKEVSNKVLQICQHHLSSQGIAYISYNTYPGWVIGNTLRDMLLYQTAPLSTAEKITQVRALLRLISTTLTPDLPYEWLLGEEAKLVATHSDNQLVHEHLGAEHHPLFFFEFVERADTFALEYLADATFYEEDRSILELQCQDYWQNRRFRSSLICHKNARQAKNVDGMLLKQVYAQLNPHLVNEQDIRISQRPRAGKLAQYQANLQPQVTNKYHDNILLTPLAQALMPFLNGEYDIFELNQIIRQWVSNGILDLVDSQQRPITDSKEIEKQVENLCLKTLRLLAQRDLLENK